jgi:hypothetical protein
MHALYTMSSVLHILVAMQLLLNLHSSIQTHVHHAPGNTSDLKVFTHSVIDSRKLHVYVAIHVTHTNSIHTTYYIHTVMALDVQDALLLPHFWKETPEVKAAFRTVKLHARAARRAEQRAAQQQAATLALAAAAAPVPVPVPVVAVTAAAGTGSAAVNSASVPAADTESDDATDNRTATATAMTTASTALVLVVCTVALSTVVLFLALLSQPPQPMVRAC